MALSDRAGNSTDSSKDDIDAAREIVAAARLITVLTGAGVSTASGIPDFRGPQGLWTKDPKAARMFDIDAYIADRGIRVVPCLILQLFQSGEIGDQFCGIGIHDRFI